MRCSTFLAGVVVLATSACASSGGPSPVTTESVDIRAPRSSLTIDTHRETFVSSDTVAAPPLEVYRAIREVFTALNFAVERADSVGLSVVSRSTLVRRELAGVRLSKLLSCGQNAAGPNADVYFVSMRLQSSVQPAGTAAALLHTNVSASARPPDNGATTVHCESNGLLERRIRERVLVNARSAR